MKHCLFLETAQFFCWHVIVVIHFSSHIKWREVEFFVPLSISSNEFVGIISGSSNATVREASPSSGPMSYDSLSNDSSTYSSIDAISSSSANAAATITNNKRTRDLALCAVLLDEWLKELAAISQEQSIVLLTDTFINHF